MEVTKSMLSTSKAVQKMSETLNLPADLSYLPQIRAFLRQAASAAGLSESAGYGLVLAVDEVATNIISYGQTGTELNGFAGQIRLKIWTQQTSQSLTVYLEDSAQRFNPFTVAPPNLDANLEERTEGGLGVYLALSSVDEFRYEAVTGSQYRNRNIFVCYKQTALLTNEQLSQVQNAW
jgi:serine/threonine-protein kinase RsbW